LLLGAWLEPDHTSDNTLEETAMQFDQITYEIKDKTAVVTLNRPEKRNALSAKLLRELHEALLEADEYNPVHCVVLRGAGPHFCAGADLSEYSSGRGEAYRGRQEIDDDVWRLEQGQRLRITLFDMHRPCLAVRHGDRRRRRADRFPAGAGSWHAARQHVAVSLRPAVGEAPAVHR
jgi:1,4-dihydroxy-2-naphthoyl-CoA synthase